MSAKLHRYMNRARHRTPYLAVDLDLVRARYQELASALPAVRLFYAVKANPAPEILRLLIELGAAFDLAGPHEVEQVLALGADPRNLSFGNTIKKEADIAAAHRAGVQLFAFDSAAELAKIARAAPGSTAVCRILTSNAGADWPLSRKFGCGPQMAAALLVQADRLGLRRLGIGFHVGSQQIDPAQFDVALAAAAAVRRQVQQAGVAVPLIDLGGGFPATYSEAVPAPAVYGRTILDSLTTHFGRDRPELMAEPGRGLVGDAGMIEAEVVLISRKGDGDRRRWVYLDIGRFGGLAETMDECIRYRVVSDRTGPVSPVVLAGPTCDSADVLYERTSCLLPDSLAIGDRVRIPATGAYTASYSSVAFNGIEPLAGYYL